MLKEWCASYLRRNGYVVKRSSRPKSSQRNASIWGNTLYGAVIGGVIGHELTAEKLKQIDPAILHAAIDALVRTLSYHAQPESEPEPEPEPEPALPDPEDFLSRFMDLNESTAERYNRRFVEFPAHTVNNTTVSVDLTNASGTYEIVNGAWGNFPKFKDLARCIVVEMIDGEFDDVETLKMSVVNGDSNVLLVTGLYFPSL